MAIFGLSTLSLNSEENSQGLTHHFGLDKHDESKKSLD